MNGRGRQMGSRPEADYIDFIKEYALKIEMEKDTQKINEFCECVKKFAKEDKAKYTQVRNIYNMVRKANDVRDLVRLRPILAYTGARNDIKRLTGILDELIKNIRDNAQLNSFKKFMEMFICYKRAVKGGS